MSYIGQDLGVGKAERFLYTATGSGTAVTADDDGLPIGYVVNQVSVYLNGVKQVIGSGKDVTATDGSTITFASAYTSGDVIEIIALSTFSPADSVAATGGTYTGQVTLPSPVINTAVSGSAILDEDAMGSNSATKLATQQSIKAYADLKAPIASPTFTGVPATPTASAATNTTQVASTAFVRTEVTNLVDSAPGALDTLNELAAALGDDAAFSTTVTNSIALKAPIASPTFTGTVTLAAGVDLATSTTGKVKQKGSFMQSSTHQAMVLGG